VAISVLADTLNNSCLAVDKSEIALLYAKHNAEMHRVKRRMVLMKGDIFDPSFLMGYTFDLIVANPPYIPSDEIDNLDVSVRKEPREALDGGKDGLDFYRCFFSRYGSFLNRGGSMLFEIGHDQGKAIRELSIDNGASCTIYRDFAGHDRVAKVTPVVL
jgi:release factor glutamine methyltransferase